MWCGAGGGLVPVLVATSDTARILLQPIITPLELALTPPLHTYAQEQHYFPHTGPFADIHS